MLISDVVDAVAPLLSGIEVGGESTDLGWGIVLWAIVGNDVGSEHSLEFFHGVVLEGVGLGVVGLPERG